MPFIIRIFIIFILGVIIQPGTVRAETRYIGDTLIVTLRKGPGNTYPSIKAIKTGAALTVQEKNGGFLKVKTVDNIEGWVAKQYTIPEPPSAVLLPKLRVKLNQLILNNKHFSQEINELKAKLASKDEAFQEGNQETLNQLNASQAEAEQLQQQLLHTTEKLNELKDKSRNVLEAQEELDRLKKSHQRLQKKAASLEQENNKMANSQMIYWFLAGGGLLLIGCLIGRSSIKSKHNSLLL